MRINDYLGKTDPEWEILELFVREIDDGVEKMNDSYWGNGRRNVRRAVKTAVMVCIEVIKKRGSDPLPLSEWQDAISLAKNLHLADYEDLDGFGVGTIVDIQMAFEKITEKYGAATEISPNVLVGI